LKCEGKERLVLKACQLWLMEEEEKESQRGTSGHAVGGRRDSVDDVCIPPPLAFVYTPQKAKEACAYIIVSQLVSQPVSHLTFQNMYLHVTPTYPHTPAILQSCSCTTPSPPRLTPYNMQDKPSLANRAREPSLEGVRVSVIIYPVTSSVLPVRVTGTTSILHACGVSGIGKTSLSTLAWLCHGGVRCGWVGPRKPRSTD
jgi:hypothetical protein